MRQLCAVVASSTAAEVPNHKCASCVTLFQHSGGSWHFPLRQLPLRQSLAAKQTLAVRQGGQVPPPQSTAIIEQEPHKHSADVRVMHMHTTASGGAAVAAAC